MNEVIWWESRSTEAVREFCVKPLASQKAENLWEIQEAFAVYPHI